MAYDEGLATRIREMFTERSVTFSEKRMMGGLCFLVDDKMCLGVVQDRLMVRLDPEIYEEALHRKSAAPMDFTGKPMRGFVFISPEGFSADNDLASWLQLGLDYNPRAKSSKKKR